MPGYRNGYPTLVIRSSTDAALGEEFVLGVVSCKWRWGVLNACDRGLVWMAGDPSHGGVVAPPGGVHLLWARHLLLARWRESRRRATVGAPSRDARLHQLDQPG